jgi:hypothetical protein
MMYIYHHLGLGDHIICNSIVRDCAKNNDKIILFVKPHNYNNVKFMYRDLKNIEYIQGNDDYVYYFLRKIPKNNILRVGFEKMNLVRDGKFDKSFYVSINKDFETRWSGFYLPRDVDSEIEIFKTFNVKEGEYVFVQEDEKRGHVIDYDLIRKDLPIVSSDQPIDLFMLCYTIENASEVHLYESSIKCLIEGLEPKGKLFYHSYVRNYPPELESTTKKEWIYLNKQQTTNNKK